MTVLECRTDPVELARGRRVLKKRLGELRQASPGLTVLKDWRPTIPVVLAEVTVQGQRTPLLVDPLFLFQRCGVRFHLPPELELHGDDWAEC